MILITKEEATQLRAVFPKVELHRTCRQKSKRHRIYCPCLEAYLRVIADTNLEAAALVTEIDRRKARRHHHTHPRRKRNSPD